MKVGLFLEAVLNGQVSFNVCSFHPQLFQLQQGLLWQLGLCVLYLAAKTFHLRSKLRHLSMETKHNKLHINLGQPSTSTAFYSLHSLQLRK